MGAKETVTKVKANDISYCYVLDDSVGQEKDAEMKGSDYLEETQGLGANT